MRGYRYLLGDSRREAARLRAQARLWDPTALALFDRLRIRADQKLLEVGPGQGSLLLELRRRVRGPVDVVERSAAFAGRLKRLCARDGFGPGRIWQADLADAPLPRAAYDVIFARWVFLFLPNPEAHVRQLARALRPGGLLAIQDYQRETWGLLPRPPDWQPYLAAERSFFAAQGGDVSVGSRMPELFRKAGLSLVEIVPHLISGRPGSPVWKWLTSYFDNVLPRYARIAPLTRQKAARLRRAWRAAERDPASLLIAPMVLDVVGRAG